MSERGVRTAPMASVPRIESEAVLIEGRWVQSSVGPDPQRLVPSADMPFKTHPWCEGMPSPVELADAVVRLRNGGGPEALTEVVNLAVQIEAARSKGE